MKSHLLLSHISLEMTHSTAVHFPLRSVTCLLQEELGLWCLAQQALPSISHTLWIIAAQITIAGHKGYCKSICIHSTRKVPGTNGSHDRLRQLKLHHLLSSLLLSLNSVNDLESDGVIFLPCVHRSFLLLACILAVLIKEEISTLIPLPLVERVRSNFC